MARQPRLSAFIPCETEGKVTKTTKRSQNFNWTSKAKNPQAPAKSVNAAKSPLATKMNLAVAST